MLGNVRELRRVNDLSERMRTQEAQAGGLTLGEFYSTFYGPAMRALWYPGVTTSLGVIPDQTGLANTLSIFGTPTINLYRELVPYFDDNGTTDYHQAPDADSLDVTGTETTVAAAIRGLTLGGWVWLDSVAANQGFIGKWTTVGNQRAYVLYFDSAAASFRLGLSTNGTAQAVSTGGPAVTAAGWNFVVGRLVPSTSYGTFINGVWTNTAASVPASIFASTSVLQVGAFATANFMNGRWAAAFVAAAAWPDSLVEMIFQRTRPLFNA